MSEDLNKDSKEAYVWSFFERFGQEFIQFFISVFLARILLPEEFGLIATLAIFLAIGQSFIDSGFQKALIQKKELTQLDKCSVFFFNIAIGFLMSLTMYFSAPIISSFYNIPELYDIIRVLSFIFLFISFGLVQDSLMAKKLDFKTLFKVNGLSVVLSGAISILLAINDYGVWSLVGLHLSSSLFKSILLWIFSSWRPKLLFGFHSLKSMYYFGSNLFFVSITNAFFVNIYQLVIGKFFSVSALGYYQRSKNLSMYPVSIIGGAVNNVSFSVFSKIQDDISSLKSHMRSTLLSVVFVTLPLMTGLAICAEPLIIILFTEKWLASVPYFQMLCLVGAFYPIQLINLNVLNAQGRSDLYLKIDLLNKAIILVLVYLTYPYGIAAMIIGQIIQSFIAYWLFSYYAGKYLNYTMLKQIRDMLPIMISTILMAFFIFFLKSFIINNIYFLITVQVLLGTIIYILICLLLKIDVVIKLFKFLKLDSKLRY